MQPYCIRSRGGVSGAGEFAGGADEIFFDDCDSSNVLMATMTDMIIFDDGSNNVK